MAEAYFNIWDFDDILYVSVTGMELTETAIRMKVGENPKVDFKINVPAFLMKLSDEELVKMKKLITKLQLSKIKIGEFSEKST